MLNLLFLIQTLLVWSQYQRKQRTDVLSIPTDVPSLTNLEYDGQFPTKFHEDADSLNYQILRLS